MSSQLVGQRRLPIMVACRRYIDRDDRHMLVIALRLAVAVFLCCAGALWVPFGIWDFVVAAVILVSVPRVWFLAVFAFCLFCTHFLPGLGLFVNAGAVFASIFIAFVMMMVYFGAKKIQQENTA